MFAQAVNGAVKSMSGGAVLLPRWLPIIGGGILMSITALIGFKAIAWLSNIAIPILLVLLVLTLVLAFRGHTLAEVFAKAAARALRPGCPSWPAPPSGRSSSRTSPATPRAKVTRSGA
jgi:purine-cytosine permease-like protein